MKYKSVTIEELIPQLEAYQFVQICKYFGVGVIDKDELRKGMGLESEVDDLGETRLNATVQHDNIKFRKDFDNMERELIEAYYKCNRHERRKCDKIFAKIYWGNKKARTLQVQHLRDTYTAAIASADEVIKATQKSQEAQKSQPDMAASDQADEHAEGDC